MDYSMIDPALLAEDERRHERMTHLSFDSIVNSPMPASSAFYGSFISQSGTPTNEAETKWSYPDPEMGQQSYASTLFQFSDQTQNQITPENGNELLDSDTGYENETAQADGSPQGEIEENPEIAPEPLAPELIPGATGSRRNKTVSKRSKNKTGNRVRPMKKQGKANLENPAKAKGDRKDKLETLTRHKFILVGDKVVLGETVLADLRNEATLIGLTSDSVPNFKIPSNRSTTGSRVIKRVTGPTRLQQEFVREVGTKQDFPGIRGKHPWDAMTLWRGGHKLGTLHSIRLQYLQASTDGRSRHPRNSKGFANVIWLKNRFLMKLPKGTYEEPGNLHRFEKDDWFR